VKGTAAEAIAPACTRTGARPGVPAGTATTALVADQDTTAAAAGPMVTRPGLVPKPDPEMVTCVPPLAGPCIGEMLEIVGAEGCMAPSIIASRERLKPFTAHRATRQGAL
jgi:hypothetical protein